MTRWTSPVLLAAALSSAALAQQPAVIVVRVPANAEVVIGSQRMTQTGAERRFVTGPLEKGTYVYDVTVSWTDGSQKYKKTRQVHFTPGKTAVIEFNTPPSVARGTVSGGRSAQLLRRSVRGSRRPAVSRGDGAAELRV